MTPQGILVTSLVFLPFQVAGWGKEGHEIVGNLAWRFLSNSTQQRICAILDDGDVYDVRPSSSPECQECSPLGEIADWADTVRYKYHWSAPLHFIDIHDDQIHGGCPVTGPQDESCHFEYTRDCPDDVCVAGAIVNYTAILTNEHRRYSSLDRSTYFTRSSSSLFIQESLKFLTHFIGDIHQPLHASRLTDRGGNTITVKFSDKGDSTQFVATRSRSRDYHRDESLRHSPNTLHAVWDSGLIQKWMRHEFSDSRMALEDHLWEWLHTKGAREYWSQWLQCPNGVVPQCTIEWGRSHGVMQLDGRIEILMTPQLSVATC